jgi:hypothetical protein
MLASVIGLPASTAATFGLTAFEIPSLSTMLRMLPANTVLQ